MDVLRERNFRLLFLGQTASTIGDQVVRVALALYVTQIGSPTDVGIVLTAATLPLVAFVLLGGVWADRLPRHRVMIVTDLVRGMLHVLLAVLIFTGNVEIWQIVVIEALFGTAQAFFQPAYSGLVPQTVMEDQIQDAKAVSAATQQAAEFVGPAIATALVLGLGAGWAFAADAATFFVSAALLARVRPRARGETIERTHWAAELRAGWDEVRSHAWIWVTITVFSLALLLSLGPWMTLGPTVADDQYGSTGVFGLLAAALGGGTLVGALIGMRLTPEHPMRIGMLCVLPWPAVTIAFALGMPLAVVIVLFVAAGVGIAIFMVLWETALAQRVPPHMLSRVTAYDWMGSLALLPIGFLLAGPLGEAFGAVEVLAVGSLIALLALAVGTAVPETWRMRRLAPR